MLRWISQFFRVIGTLLVQYDSSSSRFFSNPTILVIAFPSVVSSPSKYWAPGLVGEMETTIALTVARCLGVLIVLGDCSSWGWAFFGCFGVLLPADDPGSLEKLKAVFAMVRNSSLDTLRPLSMVAINMVSWDIWVGLLDLKVWCAYGRAGSIAHLVA